MRTTATLCACALLVLAPVSASASGEGQLKRAKRLLEQFKDRAALRALQRARRVRGNTRRVRAEIWLYIGIANYNLLKRQSASRAFRRALNISRRIALPSSVSPKIRKLWLRIKSQLPPGPRVPVKPAKVEPGKTEPGKTEPGKTEPGKTEPGKTEPGKTEPGKKEPSKKEDVEQQGALLGANEGKRDGGSRINWPAWISAGVALGAAGAAIGVGLSAKSESNAAGDLEKTFEQAEVRHAKASERALIANIMIGVAGAAAITSAIFFIVGRRAARTAKATSGDVVQLGAGVTPLPGGAIVGVSGRVW